MPKNLDTFQTVAFSLRILFKNPFLFAPKLIVAFLYGICTLWAVSLLQRLNLLVAGSPAGAVGFSSVLFSDAGLLLVVSAAAFLLDILFSGLYPVLVEQSIYGKVSFRKAFSSVKKKFWLVFSSGIVAWVAVGAVSLIISGIFWLFGLSYIFWVASCVIGFGFIFFLYFLFPTAVFKDDTVDRSFSDTVKESISNSKLVFVFSLIPFIVSVAKLALAFFSSSEAYLFLFWLLVLLTGVVYSVHVVATQVLYSKIYLHSKKSNFSKKK